MWTKGGPGSGSCTAWRIAADESRKGQTLEQSSPCGPGWPEERRGLPYRNVKDPTEVVVIFKTHLREGADTEAYRKTSRRMHELVEQIPGCISMMAHSGEDGEEIDLVRFANEDALAVWKEQPEHREAQRRGSEAVYQR